METGPSFEDPGDEKDESEHVSKEKVYLNKTKKVFFDKDKQINKMKTENVQKTQTTKNYDTKTRIEDAITSDGVILQKASSSKKIHFPRIHYLFLTWKAKKPVTIDCEGS